MLKYMYLNLHMLFMADEESEHKNIMGVTRIESGGARRDQLCGMQTR